MEVAFEKLSPQHFRSFGATQSVDLASEGELVFMRGRNAVEPSLGANGAGKSSVWDALCRCLYGKTPSRLKNPDIKPWKGQGKPQVDLTLRVGSKSHTITRVATSNGLMIDGESVGPEEAEKLIGLSYETFTNTVLLAQGQPLFFDRTPRDKLKLLTDVLQLERWEERAKRASKKARELEDLTQEMLGETSGLQIALENARDGLREAKAGAEEWAATRKERAAAPSKELAEARKRLPGLQKRHADAALAQDGAGTELKALRKQIDETQREATLATRAADGLLREIKGYESGAAILDGKLTELSESKTCPTCGQNVKPRDIATHKKEILKDLKELEAARTKAGRALREARATVEAKEESARKLREVEDKLNERRDKASSILLIVAPDLAQTEATIRATQERLTEAEEQSNPYTPQVQNLRRDVEAINKQIEDLEEDLKTAQLKLQHTQFWVKGFRDVQLFLIEEAIQEIEAVTNATLAEVGLIDWRVEYSIERETKSGTTQSGIDVTIIVPNVAGTGQSTVRLGTARQGAASQGEARNIRWESWSGGEAQRLRLVGALALSEVLLNRAGVAPNIEVLDEPTMHLSSEGVRDLCGYLSDRAKQSGRTCWLIDHVARGSQDFARIVTVVKTPKGSVIEEQ